MPQHLSTLARLVHVHLLASGRGVLIDETLDLPSADAVQEIAAAMGMAAGDVLIGLEELKGRGFLFAKSVKFTGLLPVRMLYPL
jgi:hypothetical protein